MLIDNSKIITLLNGCRKNDRHSQKEIYYLLRGFAMKICYRFANNSEESEEFVNEGFVKLFKNIYQFDEIRQDDTLLSLKRWFKRILVNTCIDHYRSLIAFASSHKLNQESKTTADHYEIDIDTLSYKEIIETIRSLSPCNRIVLNLVVIEGLRHEEISKKLGISVDESKFNLTKARDHLRKLLMNKPPIKVYVSPQR